MVGLGAANIFVLLILGFILVAILLASVLIVVLSQRK
jgi:hypothetical protein